MFMAASQNKKKARYFIWIIGLQSIHMMCLHFPKIEEKKMPLNVSSAALLIRINCQLWPIIIW